MKKAKLFVLCLAVLCVLASCGGTDDSPIATHTHNLIVQPNGQIRCLGCNEHIDENYVAIVNTTNAVQSYSYLNKSDSSIGLTVEGSNVTYTNTSGSARSIVIFTTEAQSLTINAPDDDVTHFGEVKNVNIIAVADNSYHGKATVEESITVAQGNIELEVSVPEVKVEATGNVSVNLGKEAKVESLSVETKEGTALQTVKVGGSGTVEKLEAATPIKIETKVEEVEVKSEEVSITLSGNAEVTEVKVDESVEFTSEKKLEINIEGEAKVEGVTGVDSTALETTTEPGAEPVHIHIWDSGKETTKATCTTDGIKTYSCTDKTCTETRTEIIKALGHDIEHHNAKDPTCTEVGWDAYDTCKRDGCTYTTYVEKPALGHDYKPTVVPPTSEADGYTSYECGRCHDTYKDNYVPALGHVFGEPVWTWADDYSTATAKFTCTTETGHVEEKPGIITTTVLTAATCTEDGSTQYTAKITFNETEYTDTKTVTVTKLGHDIEHHNAKDPTCTEVGWDAYDTCKRDGCTYTTYVEKKALGHNYGEPEWTWSEDNSTATAKFTCTNDSNHVETVEAGASSTVTLAATCTTKGSEKYTAVVSFEGKTYTAEKNVEIEEKPHSFDREVVDSKYLKSEATCTAKAIYYKSCECGICGTTETFESGDPLGHLADEETGICSRCSYNTKIELITFENDGKTIKDCDTSIAGSFVVPDSVTSIEADAFSGCTSLSEIILDHLEGDIKDAPWGAPSNTVIVWKKSVLQNKLYSESINQFIKDNDNWPYGLSVSVYSKSNSINYNYYGGISKMYVEEGKQDKNVMNTEDMRHYIFSITKTFTAAAIVKLADDGVISLNTPISEFFTKDGANGSILVKDYLMPYLFKDGDIANAPTVEQVLTHKSGIADFFGGDMVANMLCDIVSKNTINRILNLSLVKSLLADQDITFKNTNFAYPFKNGWDPVLLLDFIAEPAVAPGKYHYSTMDFVLLGMIIENVTGESVEKYFKDNFFDVMGIEGLKLAPREIADDSEFKAIASQQVWFTQLVEAVEDYKAIILLVEPLLKLEGVYVPSLSTEYYDLSKTAPNLNKYLGQVAWTGGAMTGTSDEVVKFGYELLSKNGEASLEGVRTLMFDSTRSLSTGRYGYGIARYNIGGKTYYGHYGQGAGTHTLMMYNVETDTCYTIISDMGYLDMVDDNLEGCIDINELLVLIEAATENL